MSEPARSRSSRSSSGRHWRSSGSGSSRRRPPAHWSRSTRAVRSARCRPIGSPSGNPSTARGDRALVIAWIALTATAILIPVALWLAVRWCLLAPVVELEAPSSFGSSAPEARLARGRWIKVGSLVGLSAAIALVAGPLLGVLLIFATNTPLALLNLVAGVVYALALPFVALVTAYVYFDVRARGELEPAGQPAELPAEIELSR